MLAQSYLALFEEDSQARYEEVNRSLTEQLRPSSSAFSLCLLSILRKIQRSRLKKETTAARLGPSPQSARMPEADEGRSSRPESAEQEC